MSKKAEVKEEKRKKEGAVKENRPIKERIQKMSEILEVRDTFLHGEC